MDHGEAPLGGRDLGNGVDRDDQPPASPTLDDDQRTRMLGVLVEEDVLNHADGLVGLVVDEEAVCVGQPPRRGAQRSPELGGRLPSDGAVGERGTPQPPRPTPRSRRLPSAEVVV
ncbi:MAG TPA: hypothetical protein VFA45_24785 [Actinomycetes bacterium]|nr:hypothetical protein [Actinomycetes bacterium]